MDCITELQSSHRRLCSLYNDLYSNQRLIVSHGFGSGQDLSISSLLKFAPIAENFQSYADDYKKELTVFQSLLNTLQQTMKRKTKNVMNTVPVSTATITATANNTVPTVVSATNIVGQLNGSHPAAAALAQQQPRNVMMNRNINRMNPLASAIDGDDHKSSDLFPPSYTKYMEHRKNATNINLTQQEEQFHGGDYRTVDITQYDDDVTHYHDITNNANANVKVQEIEQNKDGDARQRRKGKRKAKKRAAKQRENNVDNADHAVQKEAAPKKMNDDDLFRMQMDELVDFEVADNQAIHEEDEAYQQQRNEMQQRDEAKRATIELLGKNVHENMEAQQIEIPCISYAELIAPSTERTKSKTKPVYKYRDTFGVFEGKEIYTSTMLRFSGLYGLQQDNENDMNRVKNLMISQMKFSQSQIENIQIRDGRTWCIVYVRCAMKFIKDRIKSNQKETRQIMNKNRERMNNGEEAQAIYRLNEYQRRRNINLQTFKPQNAESNKLYVLNFDVLNQKCHKALTNLFLKFGDLADDVQIGINSRNDPFAKVLYKNIDDAKRLWTYQNFNADPKHKKISFGQRELTIQYAKY